MPSTIMAKVEKYAKCRAQKKILEAEMKTLATEIQEYTKTNSKKDSKGSYYIRDNGYVFGSMCRKSYKLNTEKALDYAKKHKLNCIKTTEIVDEDALSALVQSGVVPMKDIESMTDEKITYAIDVHEDEVEEEMPEVEQSHLSAPKKMKLVAGKKGNK